MDVETPKTPDPTSNLIEMKPRKREPLLQIAPTNYDRCRHHAVLVDSDDRKLTCKDCKEVLDPFTVVEEMARKERQWIWDVEEWTARRDSMLAERYDEKWEKEKDYIRTPPEDPELLKVWNIFRAYFGEKFCAMYERKQRLRSGPQWRGLDTKGGMVSLEWAKSQLIPKAIKPADE